MKRSRLDAGCLAGDERAKRSDSHFSGGSSCPPARGRGGGGGGGSAAGKTSSQSTSGSMGMVSSPKERVLPDVSISSRASNNTTTTTTTTTTTSSAEAMTANNHDDSCPQPPQYSEYNSNRIVPSLTGTTTSTTTTTTTNSCRFVSSSHSRNAVSLSDVVQEPIDAISAKLKEQPSAFHENLKGQLQEILRGGGKGRDELIMLQCLLKSRTDITKESLSRADRTQLEIIVAVHTGIPVYLLQEVNITPTFLTEIYFNERCRNVACLTVLPADGCACHACKNPGFCNLCMCVVCCKFDFDANTCRWIGCDFCCHWCHTDCALNKQGSDGRRHIGSIKTKEKSPEQEFKCPGCSHTSELFGFVKDVFQLCASAWQADVLKKELECVQRIFEGSDGEQGSQLYYEVTSALNQGLDKEEVVKRMTLFFEGGDGCGGFDHQRLTGADTDLVPSDANETPPPRRIADVVRDAVSKMEADVKAKSVDLKRARNYLEMYDRELEEKQTESRELHRERQQKKHHIEELEKIVRLKKSEADMFQMRADEARREAEGLNGIVKAKSEKLETEFSDRYKKLRLEDAETKRKTLYDLVQGLEKAKEQADTTKMDFLGSIQDLLRTVEAPKEAVK